MRQRYYIFRHKVEADKTTLEYLEGTSSWTTLFDNALLLSDLERVKKIAENHKFYCTYGHDEKQDGGFTVCVGAVDCVVAGQFVPVII